MISPAAGKIALLLTASLLFGCEIPIDPPWASPKLGEDFDLKMGHMAVVNDDLEIAFRSVPGDSRCPINACCLWEGDATVVLLFRNGPDTLHTTLEPREILDGPYHIRLVGLAPYPELLHDIPKDSYVVRVRVTLN